MKPEQMRFILPMTRWFLFGVSCGAVLISIGLAGTGCGDVPVHFGVIVFALLALSTYGAGYGNRSVSVTAANKQVELIAALEHLVDAKENEVAALRLQIATLEDFCAAFGVPVPYDRKKEGGD